MVVTLIETDDEKRRKSLDFGKRKKIELQDVSCLQLTAPSGVLSSRESHDLVHSARRLCLTNL